MTTSGRRPADDAASPSAAEDAVSSVTSRVAKRAAKGVQDRRFVVDDEQELAWVDDRKLQNPSGPRSGLSRAVFHGLIGFGSFEIA